MAQDLTLMPRQEACPTCGDPVTVWLPTDWQAAVQTGDRIPIVGCGNPWHYIFPARERQPIGEEAYVLLVSSIPALYRAWGQSPNAQAERLNQLLYTKVTDWVTAYQRVTGRKVDTYPLGRWDEGDST